MTNNKISQIIEKGHRNAVAMKLHQLGKSTTTELAKETGINIDLVNKSLKDLYDAGLVKKVAKNPINDQRRQEYELSGHGRVAAHLAETLDIFGPDVTDEVLIFSETLIKKIKKALRSGKVEEDLE